MMGKEYEDAIKEVKSRSHSVAELVALVKSMSGNLEQAIDGTVTHLLYSGSIVAGDGNYSASSVANSLRMNGVNIRHVGDTLNSTSKCNTPSPFGMLPCPFHKPTSISMRKSAPVCVMFVR